MSMDSITAKFIPASIKRVIQKLEKEIWGSKIFRVVQWQRSEVAPEIGWWGLLESETGFHSSSSGQSFEWIFALPTAECKKAIKHYKSEPNPLIKLIREASLSLSMRAHPQPLIHTLKGSLSVLKLMPRKNFNHTGNPLKSHRKHITNYIEQARNLHKRKKKLWRFTRNSTLHKRKARCGDGRISQLSGQSLQTEPNRIAPQNYTTKLST